MIDPLFGYDFINDAFDGCTYTCQTEALARMIAGENVFLSGAAGSGKTTVINTFIKRVKEHRAVAVTASTGIAAVLIGGKTIHSWAGLGIDTTPFNPKDISQFMYARSNMIRNTDTLIIDEISMLPAHLFTKLDAEFKFFRGNNAPFGGMQIIASGDFQQLPPVDRDEDVDNRFCILTDAWKDADFSYCYLDHLYRSTDTKLSAILDEIASGEVSEESKNILLSRRGNPPKGPHIQLFTTNRNVDRYNEKELEKNPAKEKVFSSHSQGSGKKISQLMKQQRIPGKVTLKVGATVMLTANLNDDGVVNGSIGEVVGFTKDKFTGKKFVVVDFEGQSVSIGQYRYDLKETVRDKNGKKREVNVATVYQIPLKLGYAITVHKSQGKTFNSVVCDLSQCFTPGLGYVALSRVRSIDDLTLTGFSDSALEVSDEAREISAQAKRKAKKGREEFMKNIGRYIKDLYP